MAGAGGGEEKKSVAGRRQEKRVIGRQAGVLHGLINSSKQVVKHQASTANSKHAYAVATKETGPQAAPDDTALAAGATGPRAPQTSGPRLTANNNNNNNVFNNFNSCSASVIAGHSHTLFGITLDGSPALSPALPAHPARRRRRLSRDGEKAQRPLTLGRRAVASFGRTVRLRRLGRLSAPFMFIHVQFSLFFFLSTPLSVLAGPLWC